MRDVLFYVNKAMERSGCKSERALCGLLGTSHNTITAYKKGVLPTEETMMKLAKIAGVDPWQALIDLCIWRSEGEAKQRYQEILKKIVSVFALLMLAGICAALPGDAHASTVHAFIVPMAQHSKNGIIHYHAFIYSKLMKKIREFFSNLPR